MTKYNKVSSAFKDITFFENLTNTKWILKRFFYSQKISNFYLISERISKTVITKTVRIKNAECFFRLLICFSLFSSSGQIATQPCPENVKGILRDSKFSEKLEWSIFYEGQRSKGRKLNRLLRRSESLQGPRRPLKC